LSLCFPMLIGLHKAQPPTHSLYRVIALQGVQEDRLLKTFLFLWAELSLK